MHKRHYLAAARLFFGALVLATVAYQFAEGSMRPHFNSANFFSFFTIESNILAATLFIWLGIWALRGHRLDGRLAFLRGAATLYMVMTGVIYVLLLAGLEESLQTPTPWVNFVLHYLMPVVVFADWLLDTPWTRWSFRQAVPWIIFPVAYAVYSLVRGAVTGWYPYPFLNPGEHGYLGVAAASVVIAPGILAVVAFLAWTTRRGPAPKKAKARRT